MELKDIKIIVNENSITLYKNNINKVVLNKCDIGDELYKDINDFVLKGISPRNTKKVEFKSDKDVYISKNMSDAVNYLVKNKYCSSQKQGKEIIKEYLDSDRLYKDELSIYKHEEGNWEKSNAKKVVVLDMDNNKEYNFNSVLELAKWFKDKGLYSNIESSRRAVYKKIEKDSLLKNRYKIFYKIKKDTT